MLNATPKEIVMTTMNDAQGRDFVARWPQNMAKQFGASVDNVAEAMRRVGVIADTDAEARLRAAFSRGEYVAEVGALSLRTARHVLAALAKISKKIEVIRFIDDISDIRETERRDLVIDLDAVHRIDTRTWTPPEAGVVCDQMTLATTADGTPIVICEDVRDSEGSYIHAETGKPYTIMWPRIIYVFKDLERARDFRDEEFADEAPGTTGYFTYKD